MELSNDANNIEWSADLLNTNEEKEEDETFLDLSTTGLTTIPSTIFKKNEITKLDLSENNIRSIPMEIRHLKNLKSLNVSKNGFRCTNPNDTTILPTSMTKLKHLEYLNISECSLLFLPNIIWECITLKYLDISRNKVQNGILPNSVGNLDQLKWLSCQHMALTSIPDEIVGCQSLQTLLLFGNQIQSLPGVLADIPELSVLAIDWREMSTSGVDDNTRSLLRSGQIRSDHISNTLFELCCLKSLDLRFCNLNYLKSFKSTQLTELYLTGNFFKDIPESILSITTLQLLDLSHNLLHIIKKSIQALNNLSELYLDNNLIESVNSVLMQMESLTILSLNNNKISTLHISDSMDNVKLTSLFVSHNNLVDIPVNIWRLKTLENFDITNNRIEKLPIEVAKLENIKQMHLYKGLQRVGLWLLNNPIVFPPKSVWHTTVPEKLFAYLEKIKLQRINKQTPVKIILFGDEDNVKDVFVNKLTSVQSEIKPTQFISIRKWQSPNMIPFVFVNVSSNPIYNLIWSHIIDDNSLIWIFVNLDFIEQLNIQIP